MPFLCAASQYWFSTTIFELCNRHMGYSETLVTALRDDSESLFSIFPNPVGDVLNINGPVHNIKQIQLFDMQGKSMVAEFSGANTLKVDDLSPGAYHLWLRHSTGTESLTLIKH